MFHANFAQTRGNYSRGSYAGGFQRNYHGGKLSGFPSRNFLDLMVSMEDITVLVVMIKVKICIK